MRYDSNQSTLVSDGGRNIRILYLSIKTSDTTVLKYSFTGRSPAFEIKSKNTEEEEDDDEWTLSDCYKSLIYSSALN